MKLRTRKVLTLLLVAAMVVSLAVPAFAADGVLCDAVYL